MELVHICQLNNYTQPIYRFVRKHDINEQDIIKRKLYEVNVEVEGLVFSGQSLSRRMARNFAAIEAIKYLRFKKCRRNAVTELVRMCYDNSLLPPVFSETLKNGIHSSVAKVDLYVSQHSVCLEGKGYSDSAKMAKMAAANDLLDQLLVIFEFAEYHEHPE